MLKTNDFNKKSAKHIFIGWLFLFVFFFVGELILESKNIVDSIGIVYTIYVALVLSTITLTLVVVSSIYFKKVFKKPE